MENSDDDEGECNNLSEVKACLVHQTATKRALTEHTSGEQVVSEVSKQAERRFEREENVSTNV